MTGDDVRKLRESLTLTPRHLADLVGVHLTTVYRWQKAGSAELRLEPLQKDLLHHILKRAREGKRLGQQLIIGLSSGGTLMGLACLLDDLDNDKPHKRYF